MYILDEPTTGLHIADVHKLIDILQRLVDTGNTIIVIEHNLDLIKTCDHIIDLGPEGGDNGGEVVAIGTPEQICKNERSYTGKFLKKYINDVDNFFDYINLIKTKRYTYNKLNRMFIHILTSFTKEDAKDIDITYIKVLGFNSKGKTYLKKIKKDINIPLITSYKNMNDKILNIEYKVTCIYSILVNDDTLIKKELEKPIIIE